MLLALGAAVTYFPQRTNIFILYQIREIMQCLHVLPNKESKSDEGGNASEGHDDEMRKCSKQAQLTNMYKSIKAHVVYVKQLLSLYIIVNITGGVCLSRCFCHIVCSVHPSCSFRLQVTMVTPKVSTFSD